MLPRDQLQPANVLVSAARNALTIIGPTVAGLLVASVGAGWALAFDGISYLAAAALLLPVKLPRPVRTEPGSAIWDLREGWVYFRSTTWLWVVVLAFCAICAVHQGGFFTLGPVLAKETSLQEEGWGLILSAEAVGLLLTTLVFPRVPLQRPLFWGMIGAAIDGLPLIVLGARRGLGLAAGPLAELYGIRPVVLVAGVAVVGICLATLASRSVRDLPRAVSTTAERVS